MPTTTTKRSAAKPRPTSATAPAKAVEPGRLIDTLQDAEQSSIEAVRKFVDTVDHAFPDVIDDGPRHQIIASAFDMVEQLVRASNELARDVVKVSQRAIGEAERSHE